MNEEISKNLTKKQNEDDDTWKGVQNSMIKGVNAVLQMNSMIASSNLSSEQKTKSAQICIDMTQMMSKSCLEISEKRRGFAKSNIAHDYKDLCDISRPITKNLFGDNIPEDMKCLKLTKQLAARNYGYNKFSTSFLSRGRGRGQARAPLQHYQQQQHQQYRHQTRNARGKRPFKRY